MRQGPHQLAQKFKTTGLPLYSESLCAVPSASCTVKSGASLKASLLSSAAAVVCSAPAFAAMLSCPSAARLSALLSELLSAFDSACNCEPLCPAANLRYSVPPPTSTTRSSSAKIHVVFFFICSFPFPVRILSSDCEEGEQAPHGACRHQDADQNQEDAAHAVDDAVVRLNHGKTLLQTIDQRSADQERNTEAQ